MSNDSSGFGLARLKVEGGIYFPDGRSFVPGDVGYEEAKAEVGAQRAARDDKCRITLPSGRKFYANKLIVGIDDKGGVFEGYDGGVSDDEFSPAECIELADLMIARWTYYKRLAKQKD